MTIQPTKKIHHPGHNLAAVVIVWLAGLVEALLIARLVGRLLAARPGNPAFTLLYGVTDPLVTWLAFLDYDQPPYGAALEFSTLALVCCVALVAYLAWVLLAALASVRG